MIRNDFQGKHQISIQAIIVMTYKKPPIERYQDNWVLKNACQLVNINKINPHQEKREIESDLLG